MADIVFVATALAFFAICAVYVRWCDRIVGPDPAVDSGADIAVDAEVTP